MGKKTQKSKKLFDVEFTQEIVDSVVNHYIERLDESEVSDKTINDAVLYGIEITLGRIIHEAVPRIAQSLSEEFEGYRITIDLVKKGLKNPLDIVDTEQGLIINTKIKQKIGF